MTKRSVPTFRLLAITAAISWFGAANSLAAEEKTPIKVGAVSSAAVFPDSINGVKAYFNMINSSGGIRNRKLVLIEADDKGDPAAAKEAARRLVEDEGIVANVGSASVMECSVNADYYVRNGVTSIQGIGVDPACFDSPNISPVNTGPFIGLATALQFASDVLKRDKICVVTFHGPGMADVYDRVIAKWSAVSRKKLVLVDHNFQLDDDPTPFVLKTKRAGCQAVVFTGIEPMIIAWVKAARLKRIEDIDWIFLTPAYTDGVAKALGPLGNGIYAMSEFEPWSNQSLGVWRHIMARSKVPVTSFSEGGYLAAEVFVNALRSIRGEINRESVTQAMKKLRHYNTPLAGTPYSFGPGDRHNSNRATLAMRLDDGRWSIAHKQWIVFPAE
jgi:branched-chain amino acid transport system substrate-binding protein